MQCPTCHRDNEIHAGPGGVAPEPGDVSICWKCGEVGIFTVIGIRKPTKDELNKIMKRVDVQQALGAMAMSNDPVDAVNALGRRKHVD